MCEQCENRGTTANVKENWVNYASPINSIKDGSRPVYHNSKIIKELVEILNRHEREIAENRQRISELIFRTSHV